LNFADDLKDSSKTSQVFIAGSAPVRKTGIRDSRKIKAEFLTDFIKRRLREPLRNTKEYIK